MKNAQIKQLQHTLGECFSRTDLRQFVFYHFDEDLPKIVSEKENDQVACFEFLMWVKQKHGPEGLLKVLRCALNEQPEQPALKDLASQLGVEIPSSDQIPKNKSNKNSVSARGRTIAQDEVPREHWLGFLGHSDAWSSISKTLGISKPESPRFRPLSPISGSKHSTAMIIRYHDDADCIGLLSEAISHHLCSEGDIPELDNAGWAEVKQFNLPSSGHSTDLMANLALEYGGVEDATVSQVLTSSNDALTELAALIEKSYTDDAGQSRVARAILHDASSSLGQTKLATIKEFIDWWEARDWSHFTQPVLIVFFVLTEQKIPWHKRIIRSVFSSSVNLDNTVSLAPVSDPEFLAWKDNFLDTKLKMASRDNPPDWWERVRKLDWPSTVAEWLKRNSAAKTIRIKHVEKILFQEDSAN